ncbi:MAG: hypothetical protein J6K29_04025 [Clostridia bacterium]|nr:hypothetical protein [Clostridia bacterium]
MGFGLLLCAYFLFTFMSVAIGDYCFATFIIGAMVTVKAVSGLKDYNLRFTWLYPFAALYGLLAVFFAARVLDELFLWNLPIHGDSVAEGIAEWVKFVSELGFTIIALWSSAEIAASVGLDKHRERALRNMIFTGIWGVAQVVLLVVPGLATAGNGALQKVLLLYLLVVYLLNSFCFYGCFSAICPQGEEFGKPSKPSRFKFMNELNRKLDEKNEQARLEYEKNLQKQNQKYSAKNNNRHHKKKK